MDSETTLPSLQVKLIKLITNEDIIVTLDKDKCFENDIIYAIDPIVLHSQNVVINDNTMQVFFMRPWMPGSDDTVYTIPMSRIITIADLSEKFEDKYIEFLSSNDDELPDELEEDLTDDDFDDMFQHDTPDKPTYH